MVVEKYGNQSEADQVSLQESEARESSSEEMEEDRAVVTHEERLHPVATSSSIAVVIPFSRDKNSVCRSLPDCSAGASLVERPVYE